MSKKLLQCKITKNYRKLSQICWLRGFQSDLSLEMMHQRGQTHFHGLPNMINGSCTIPWSTISFTYGHYCITHHQIVEKQ